jgi:hypothetical protein
MKKLKIIEHILLEGVVQVAKKGSSFAYDDWPLPYRILIGRDAVLAAHG